MTDVHDIVRAYRLLALHGEPGEIYNICSGSGGFDAERPGNHAPQPQPGQ